MLQVHVARVVKFPGDGVAEGGGKESAKLRGMCERSAGRVYCKHRVIYYDALAILVGSLASKGMSAIPAVKNLLRR